MFSEGEWCLIGVYYYAQVPGSVGCWQGEWVKQNIDMVSDALFGREHQQSIFARLSCRQFDLTKKRHIQRIEKQQLIQYVVVYQCSEPNHLVTTAGVLVIPTQDWFITEIEAGVCSHSPFSLGRSGQGWQGTHRGPDCRGFIIHRPNLTQTQGGVWQYNVYVTRNKHKSP